jgi:hypothetical protein
VHRSNAVALVPPSDPCHQEAIVALAFELLHDGHLHLNYLVGVQILNLYLIEILLAIIISPSMLTSHFFHRLEMVVLLYVLGLK